MRRPSPGLRPPSPRRAGRGALLALLLIATFAFADTEETRRADAGVRIFGTLVSADLDLSKKTVDDGKVLLLVYYTSDAARAEALARALRLTPTGEPKKIGGLPVHVETTSDATFRTYGKRAPAGVFLAQPPDSKTLRAIIQYGIANRLIVYSPFEGHVESGVLGGLSIGAQVKPYVNAATMQASHISLKPLFMKVTKVYR